MLNQDSRSSSFLLLRSDRQRFTWVNSLRNASLFGNLFYSGWPPFLRISMKFTLPQWPSTFLFLQKL